MFLQYDKHNTSFVCKGLDVNIQPALCLDTLTQTGGPFTPPYPHPCFTSWVNIIYGVYSRFFFHSDPQMKELILCFLPHSPSHTLSHISFPAISLTHTRTDGCNSFHFLPSFRSVREQAAAAQVILSHSPPRHQVWAWKHSCWDRLHSFWDHSAVDGGGGGTLGCYSCTHMTYMSHTCTHFDHTYCKQGALSSLTIARVKWSWATAERWQRLAGESTQLLS